MSEPIDIGLAIALSDGVSAQRSRARGDAEGRRTVLIAGLPPIGRLREVGAAALTAGSAALGTAPTSARATDESATMQDESAGVWADAAKAIRSGRVTQLAKAESSASRVHAFSPSRLVGADFSRSSSDVPGQDAPKAMRAGGARPVVAGAPAASMRPLSVVKAFSGVSEARLTRLGEQGFRSGSTQPAVPGWLGAQGDNAAVQNGLASAAPINPADTPHLSGGVRTDVTGRPADWESRTAAPYAPIAKRWSARADDGLDRTAQAAPGSWSQGGNVASGGKGGDLPLGGGRDGGGDRDDSGLAAGHGDRSGKQQIQGDVFLDGALVGRWMSRWLTGEAERASAGRTGFDVRRGRLLPGPTVGT